MKKNRKEVLMQTSSSSNNQKTSRTKDLVLRSFQREDRKFQWHAVLMDIENPEFMDVIATSTETFETIDEASQSAHKFKELMADAKVLSYRTVPFRLA